MKVGLRSKWQFKLLFGLLSAGLLIGCSAEAENGSVVESNTEVMTPEGVENGTVSQEFYNEIVRLYEEGEGLEIKQDEIIAMADPYFEKSGDIPFRKDAAQHTEDYEAFLDTLKFSPSNDSEDELTSKINEYVDAKKKEIEFIGVALSLGNSSPDSFGMLLQFQEKADLVESEMLTLLDKYKLGYKY